jgi:thiamine biosynthesis lipoprotein
MLADVLPGGFLVNLGGDIAVGGEPPRGGWSIGIDDAAGRTLQVVTSVGQAVATSSTQRRAWLGDDGPHHHIVDPRTGRTAATVWAQVSCAGATCLEANAASTAAIILGEDAPEWLVSQGVPARLDGVDSRVVRTPGWPDPVVKAA